MKKKQQGFTLIEIAIVLLIIGLLLPFRIAIVDYRVTMLVLQHI